VLGTHYTTDDVYKLGAETLRKERAFNEAAGFSQVDDRVPEFMTYEQLPPHNVVFDVPDAALDAVYGQL
jgi:aldehyde:ferredoxin oxidoreductase